MPRNPSGSTHDPLVCAREPGSRHVHPAILNNRGGGASHVLVCPHCGRRGRFLDNLIGRERHVLCDGRRFVLPKRQTLEQVVRALDQTTALYATVPWS